MLVILTIGILFGNYTCIHVCTALHNSVCFLSSVCFALCYLCLYRVNVYINYVEHCHVWHPEQHLTISWNYKIYTLFFFSFLNLTKTTQVPNSMLCVPLYVLHFMLPFMGLFSCSSVIFLNSFLNIYIGIMLPSLPVSILNGISTVVLPT